MSSTSPSSMRPHSKCRFSTLIATSRAPILSIALAAVVPTHVFLPSPRSVSPSLSPLSHSRSPSSPQTVSVCTSIVPCPTNYVIGERLRWCRRCTRWFHASCLPSGIPYNSDWHPLPTDQHDYSYPYPPEDRAVDSSLWHSLASLPIFRGPVSIAPSNLIKYPFIAFESIQRRVDRAYEQHTCPYDLHDWLCAEVTISLCDSTLVPHYVDAYMALKPENFIWYACPTCASRI